MEDGREKDKRREHNRPAAVQCPAVRAAFMAAARWHRQRWRQGRRQGRREARDDRRREGRQEGGAEPAEVWPESAEADNRKVPTEAQALRRCSDSHKETHGGKCVCAKKI